MNEAPPVTNTSFPVQKALWTSTLHGLLDNLRQIGLQFFDSIIIGCHRPGRPPHAFDFGPVPNKRANNRGYLFRAVWIRGNCESEFRAKDTASVSAGATATIGFPAARIPYILLGTTTPSRPRFTVMTCTSGAARTEGILLAGKNGRNRTFFASFASPSTCALCAPSPTNTRPTPCGSKLRIAVIKVSHAP